MRLFKTSSATVPRAWKVFLKVYACFALMTSFSGTFINTYLIRATGSDRNVMIFNIILAVVQPFFMLLAVYLMRLKSAIFSQRIGFGLYAAAFGLLGVMGEGAVKYIQWIAAMLSAANGFFYTTYALQLLDYVDDGSRDASYGLQTALSGVIGIVLPALTGVLLAAFSDFTGYRIIFFAGLTVSLGAVWLSGRLRPLTNVTPKVHIRRALHVLLTEKPARAAMLASMANGFYGGTMSFFLSVLIYSIVANEAVLGFTNTAASIVGILSSMAYARIVRPDNRRKVILVSLGIMLAAALMLMIEVSLVTLIAFNLLLSALGCFFLNPPTTAYVGVVEHLKSLKGLGGEVHALREFWYGSGRVLGILITMALSGMENGAAVVIMIILAVQIVPAILMKHMQVKEE